MDQKILRSTSTLFDGRRLTLARLYNELTKAELADRIGVSPASIGQYESGKTQPRSDTIAKLKWELKFPVAFFESGRASFSLKRTDAHFRSLTSASKKKKDKLLVKAEFALELVNYIERHVDMPLLNLPNVVLEGETLEDMEQAADQARAEWGLGSGPINKFVRLLEKQGLIVLNLPHEDRKVDAFSTTIGERPLIFLNNEYAVSACRQRLNAAHEFGHILLHQDLEAGSRIIERQAYRFGAAMLMPRNVIYEELPNRVHWKTFLDLKLRWKCSIKALLKRAADLETISEDQYKRGIIEYNRNQWNKGEPGDEEIGAVEQPLLMQRAIELLESEKRIGIEEYTKTLRLELEHLRPAMPNHSSKKVQLVL